MSPPTRKGATVRKRLAIATRRVAAWSWIPGWIYRPLERIAFWAHPHLLTCKLCAARFIQPIPGSLAHARQAYRHYVEEHEERTNQPAPADANGKEQA